MECGWEKKPIGWEENIKTSLKIQKEHSTEKCKSIDANYTNIDGIFVLAGGINKNGECHPFVIERLIAALDIYNKIKKPIFCIGGGSYHVPPILNKKGYTIHESTSCAEYLIKNGIAPTNIYKEWASYDTIANGYFMFLKFILPFKMKKILVITSEFHMDRVRVILQWMCNIFDSDINIVYKHTDNILDGLDIKCRIEREKKSMESLQKKVIHKVKNLEEFNRWFYTEHKAYASNSELLRENEPVIAADVLKTY